MHVASSFNTANSKQDRITGFSELLSVYNEFQHFTMDKFLWRFCILGDAAHTPLLEGIKQICPTIIDINHMVQGLKPFMFSQNLRQNLLQLVFKASKMQTNEVQA